MLTSGQIAEFQKLIYDYYLANKRVFPWRLDPTAYQVVVSEIMLQQTQCDRVVPKYTKFIEKLPDFHALAKASSKDVLSLWQGLGYNRRGLALHAIGQEVVSAYRGILPQEPDLLQKFKGIGPATAASICAFAFNKPTVFIETNIRAVFIHVFFAHQEKVDDKEIQLLVNQTLDHKQPREWYYALMDYGVMLKQKFKNPARKSRHYHTQSRFEGSDRQIRGAIIKALTNSHVLTLEQLIIIVQKDRHRVIQNLEKLCQEDMVKQENTDYFL